MCFGMTSILQPYSGYNNQLEDHVTKLVVCSRWENVVANNDGTIFLFFLFFCYGCFWGLLVARQTWRAKLNFHRPLPACQLQAKNRGCVQQSRISDWHGGVG